MQNKPQITGHMIVKNEDRWIWFSIQSVLPYVNKLLIYDTGSTDQTIKIIESIKNKKICFEKLTIKSREEITNLRQKQIEETKTNWFWVIDGDEIYPKITAEEAMSAVNNKYSVIAVRRYDLLGDIYHHQLESIGTYDLFGNKGHLVTRLFNKDKLSGLHLSGDYPNEGYFTKGKKSTRDIDIKKVYITKNKLFHTMYLRRSNLNDSSIFNRGKYKIETGLVIQNQIPEVFYLKRPKFVPNPLKKRSIIYEVLASIITPIKNLKRKFL